MRRSRSLIVGAIASLAVLSFTGTAHADGGNGDHDTRVVKAVDDCDRPTFNRAIGPGTCVVDGDTTFARFLAQLRAKGSAEDWEFRPMRPEIDRGDQVRVVVDGGEFHTFTEVRQFGGGCVEFLNDILHLSPVPECNRPKVFERTGVAPGDPLLVRGLSPGKHKFMCLIHPWMRAVVEVEQHH